LALSFVFVLLMISIGIWWCNYREQRSHRQHIASMAVKNILEQEKQQRECVSSPSNIMLATTTNKPPPVPPRPTAYTTILGHLEYRSNL
jgi:cbb3-type cytochrome oxidase subunit 3